MNHVTWGILVTGGKSEQLASGVESAYFDLAGKTVLSYALHAFEQCHDIGGVVVASAPERVEQTLGICQLYGISKVRKIVPGTATFFGSVQHALKMVPEDVPLVCLHGAARPCIHAPLVAELIKAARKEGAAAAGAPVGGVLLTTGKGDVVKETVDASAFWSLQLPAVCRVDWLQQALAAAAKKKGHPEDLVELLGLIKKPVKLVANPRPNILLKQPTDLMMAVALLA